MAREVGGLGLEGRDCGGGGELFDVFGCCEIGGGAGCE